MSDPDSGQPPETSTETVEVGLDAIPDAAVVAGLESERIRAANEQAAALFEHSREELIGRHMLSCHPTEKAPQYRDLFEQSIRKETNFDSLPDGTPAYVQTGSDRTVPVAISAQEISHTGTPCILGVFREIRSRRETERNLERLKDRFRTIFEHSNDAIVVLDPETESIREVNDQACEMLGYSREGLLSVSAAEIHPDELSSFRSFISAVRETDRKWTDELTCRTKQGAQLETEISASLVEFDGEEYVLAMIRNVTERVERARKLQRQREKLEVLNQVVRHDIRNHMQVILARKELLETPPDTPAEPHFQEILQAAESTVDLTKTARELTETMLEDSVTLTPIRLDRIVESEVHSISTRYPEAEITVFGELPETTVLGDEMLESVVHNIIANAIVHNDTEGPTVEISLVDRPETAALSIADNGPGIPDEQKEAVFGKGEKGLDSPGTGLGLYLGRTLVTQYGGTVRVDDNQPRGSVFTVEFEKPDK